MTASGPLSGVTIVDLTRVLAGPFSTMILADLGARVIKVETPGTGDDAREYGPFVGGKSAYFISVNRGKESIALDLKKDEDRAVFEKLLAKADVVVENFRPGTMEKLGYGWDTLHAKYPKLIYAACSGFGHTGPHSKRPAYDMVVQAMGGIMSITGQPGGEPTRVGMSIGDVAAGLYTTIGINAALYDRATTGEGRKVDIGMFDVQMALMENAIVRYSATGEIPGPLGGRHPSITPFQVFKTQDGHMIVAGGNDTMYRRFCEIIERPDLATNPLFATNRLRNEHHDALEAEIQGVLTTRPTAAWLELLDAAGVPASRINDVSQVMQHPQVEPRNMVIDVTDPKAGSLRVAGNPVKISGYDDPTSRPTAPDVDQDREKILRELAG
ncbi:CoA:oxalate CoA-transferase [Constrictibacter sp. MBR-5]|jgi:CoA:oxalate CoA-transferase|uniref:CaiB/BaiF CoA transferase family protein n=1 Tax=Constrictibacter sp. MBR-5 TaxID=3156467 RepID=UPI003394571E